MKALFYLTCLWALYSSCSKDDNIQETNGTKLLAITYQERNDPNTWTQVYSYDTNGFLDTVEDQDSFGKVYQMKYQGNQLRQYTTFDVTDSRILARDSMAYNPNGTLRAIYTFELVSGAVLELNRIDEFKYSEEGNVLEKKSFSGTTGEITASEKYFWKNLNIERSEYFNNEGGLRIDVVSTYDTKMNYKKNIPIFSSEPANWSDNNVIKAGIMDYTGSINFACNPCITEYTYNLDDYPVSIKYENGAHLSLRYE